MVVRELARWLARPLMRKSKIDEVNVKKLLEMSMYWGGARVPRDYDEGNFLTVGDIGAGKTLHMLLWLSSVFCHMPEGIDWNAMVYDPKWDFFPVAHNLDLPEGTRLVSANPIDLCGWGWDVGREELNPLQCNYLAKIIAPPDKKSNSPFYENAPSRQFAATLYGLSLLKRPFTIRQALLITLNRRYARQLYRQSEDELVKMALKYLSEDQGNVAANLDTSLDQKFADQLIFAAMLDHTKKKYTIDEMLSSNNMYFFGGDYEFGDLLQPFYLTQWAIAQDRLLAKPNSRTRRTYMVADEAHELINGGDPKHAENFVRFNCMSRSRGCRSHLVLQSTSQLKKVLGEELAWILVAASQNQVWFRCSDAKASEDASLMFPRLKGYEWLRNFSSGSSYSPDSGSSNSSAGVSESYFDRPMVPSDAVRALRLADLTGHGIEGYAVSPRLVGCPFWKFTISPQELFSMLVPPHPDVPAYETRRRRKEHMQVKPLNPYEIKPFGLEWDPDGYTP